MTRRARAQRVRRPFGIASTDNRPMLALARRLGFGVRRQPADAVVSPLELAPGDAEASTPPPRSQP